MPSYPSCLGLALLVAACGEPQQTHEVRVWGEAFVEDVIPAAEVSDGWSIDFTEFLVAVGDVAIEADDRVELQGWRVYDLTRPSDGAGQPFDFVHARGELRTVEYWIGRLPEQPIGGNASPEQIDRLRAGGLALLVAGEATRGDERMGFRWELPAELGHRCSLQQEIATPVPGTITLTIHADHLFLDDLEHDPNVAFDLVAGADVDGDGVVVASELAAVDIRALERYQTGSREIPDLWNYVGALAGTLGHVDGEGGCDPVQVPRHYIDRESPFAPGEASGAAGFAQHCASCHGAQGRGDGPLSDTGWPAASDLTRLPAPAVADDYLFSRIHEGGGFFPFNSSMPALGGALEDDEIWRIAAYVQGLAGT